MKSKRAWKWLAGGLVAVVAVAGLSLHILHAQPAGDRWGSGWGHGHLGGLGVMLHGLDLTQDQKHQLAKILSAHKAELLQARNAMSQAGKTMVEGVVDQSAQLTALQAKMDALADAGKRAGRVMLGIRQEVMGILTPEQKAQLAKRQQRFLQRMEARMSERHQDQEQRLDDWIETLSK